MEQQQKKRRRLPPKEAKEGILSAAEKVIINDGPAELKFETIAKEAGVSKANITYHFGSIAEVKRALLNRGMSQISNSVAKALFDSINDQERPRIEAAVQAVYDVMVTQQSVRTLAWLIFSADENNISDIERQLKLVESLILYNLPKIIPDEEAKEIAAMIVYKVLVVASGDALLGTLVKNALGNEHGRLDAKKMLIDHITAHVERR